MIGPAGWGAIPRALTVGGRAAILHASREHEESAMRTRLRAGAAAAALLCTALPAGVAGQQTVALVGVNVISMEREGEVLSDQTVVVRDGRIAQIGPRAMTEVPAGATRVDAQGRWVIPGLAEMHGHIPGTGPQAINPQWQEDVLFM
jgi:hypothetical protein